MITEMNKFGFGIIGCGVIAQWHATSVEEIEEAELRGVYDVNSESAQAFAKDHNATAYSDLDTMLAQDDIQIICICTPSGLHADLAIKAANAGKHIVVEKPMAITKEQLDGMVKACEENKVKATVISQLRFTKAIKKVKDAINRGLLGKILIANVHMKYYRSAEYFKTAKWRGTDMLNYLAGPIKSVYGYCRTLKHNVEVEDAAQVLVEYKNGAIGTIEGTTCVTPGYPRKIEICGEKGSIVLSEDRIITWDIEGSESQVDEKESKHLNFNNPTAFSSKHHVLQLRDLIDAIKNDRKPTVDIYDGRQAVDIILAAYESSKTHKKVEL